MNTSRGYTLAETIVVVALFAILSGALALFYIYFDRTFIYEESLNTTDMAAGVAAQDIQNYTILADQVLASTTVNGTNYVTATTTLVLQVPSIDSSNAIISGSFDTVVYNLAGGILSRITSASTQSVRASGTNQLATGVTSLTFTYDNTDRTQVTNVNTSLSVTTTVQTGTVSHTFHEKAYLRNFSPP